MIFLRGISANWLGCLVCFFGMMAHALHDRSYDAGRSPCLPFSSNKIRARILLPPNGRYSSCFPRAEDVVSPLYSSSVTMRFKIEQNAKTASVSNKRDQDENTEKGTRDDEESR